MAKLMVLHGPNLNLLGEREPEIYGSVSLEEINRRMLARARDHGHELISFQSQAEHVLIEQVHDAKRVGINFIIINPGAFAHTSIALRDALLAINIPFIEVHLSNIFSREEFRRNSYLSDIAVAVISGLGVIGYELAIAAAAEKLSGQ